MGDEAVLWLSGAGCLTAGDQGWGEGQGRVDGAGLQAGATFWGSPRVWAAALAWDSGGRTVRGVEGEGWGPVQVCTACEGAGAGRGDRLIRGKEGGREAFLRGHLDPKEYSYHDLKSKVDLPLT